MLTKNDCMSILVQLEDKGENIDACMRELLTSKDIPLNVLRFISEHQGIEVSKFYEMLRKNHNKKKSPLYTNILNGAETVTTLSCFLTQILLYGNKLDDPEPFYKEARANEVTSVLNSYFTEGDITNCEKLLTLIRSDLLVLEYIAGRRELA